jgi:uridylate kinase
VGGGRVCRVYQKALLEFGAKDKERDWMGIAVSRLNAEVVKNVFLKNSHPTIISDPAKKITSNKSVLLGAGWKPGWSTDYCSVMMAKTLGGNTVINLTNIDYVFNKDPIKFPDAKLIKEINWKDFRRITGDKWRPGLSLPFDPRAAKFAEKLKLKVVIINGKHLERLEDFLNEKPIIGTIIC